MSYFEKKGLGLKLSLAGTLIVLGFTVSGVIPEVSAQTPNTTNNTSANNDTAVKNTNQQTNLFSGADVAGVASTTTFPGEDTTGQSNAAQPADSSVSPLANRYSNQQQEQKLLRQLQQLNPMDADYQAKQQDILNQLNQIRQQNQQLMYNEMAQQTFSNLPANNRMNNSGLPSDADIAALTANQAGMDPFFLQQRKAELTQQIRQIQQTLRFLQPQDEAFAQNLQNQQKELLEQLKNVNEALMNQSANKNEMGTAFPATSDMPDNPALLGNESQLIGDLGNEPPLASGMQVDKVQLVNQAIRLLRQAGLNNLADHAMLEVPRLSDPNFVETPIIGAQNGTFDAQGEIEKLNATITGLKSQVEAISADLALLKGQQVPAPA
ncbi:MAG: hypothetical protein IKW74_05280, partial [Thermoguttaceae bacterium]|nr:hypothetical protein [Thermoguttaceae bacterium]